MAGPNRDVSSRRDKVRMMDVSVEIHCEACGSANYSLPAETAADGPITCNDCGADQGSVAALKAALVAQVRAQSAETLRRDADRLRKAGE